MMLQESDEARELIHLQLGRWCLVTVADEADGDSIMGVFTIELFDPFVANLYETIISSVAVTDDKMVSETAISENLVDLTDCGGISA